MAVQERTIEVTVISGSDLKKVKKFGFEQKCFVQAFIYPTQKKQTEEDLYGGVNPNWNEKLTLTCFESHIHPPSNAEASSTSQVLTVNACCKSSGLLHHEPHLLGTVTIPLRDIGTRAIPEGIMRSYDVHREAGEVKGSLFLSVKLGATRELEQFEDPSASKLSSYSSEKVASSTVPIQNFPASNWNNTTAVNEKSHVPTTPRQAEKATSSHKNIVDSQVDDEPVMGYPATSVFGYDFLNQIPAPDQREAHGRGFDSVNQMPVPDQRQAQGRGFDSVNQMPVPDQRQAQGRGFDYHNQMPAPDQRQAQGRFDPLGQYSAQNQQQQSYENIRGGYPTYPPNNDFRGGMRMQRRRGRNRRCRRGGPIKLVRMIILGPMVMGLRQLHRHVEQRYN